MRKKVRIILFLLLPMIMATGSRPDKEKMEWLSLDEAQRRQTADGKPILVDLYTDWCGWCKVMDKKTYARKEVAAYARQKFHLVKINAESKEDLVWRGKKYRYNPQMRMHDLAVFFTQGQLSFPHTIFLLQDQVQPQAIPGYLEISDMELLMTFFGDGHFPKQSFADYQKKFSPSWK